jgi:hypothetical protein
LVEMGLGQVIGRHTAYLKYDYEIGKITNQDFLSFIRISERLYFFIVVIVGVIALVIGMWWFGHENSEWRFSVHLIVAWLVYVLGGMISIMAAYYSALINGVGEMWITQRANIFAACLSLLVLLSMLIFPAMLLLPAIAMTGSQLLLLLIVRRELFNLDIVRSVSKPHKISQKDSKTTVIKIGTDALKMLLLMTYYHLLTNGFVLIMSRHVDRQHVASYGITMQLIVVVMSISWAI